MRVRVRIRVRVRVRIKIVRGEIDHRRVTAALTLALDAPRS